VWTRPSSGPWGEGRSPGKGDSGTRRPPATSLPGFDASHPGEPGGWMRTPHPSTGDTGAGDGGQPVEEQDHGTGVLPDCCAG
jgi:hypothetical protein